MKDRITVFKVERLAAKLKKLRQSFGSAFFTQSRVTLTTSDSRLLAIPLIVALVHSASGNLNYFCVTLLNISFGVYNPSPLGEEYLKS